MSKLSKKELRTPDQVWQASAQTFGWLKSNWIISLIVVALGFGLLVATLYVQQLRTKTEAEAQAHYGEVASLFEQWLLADTAGRVDIEKKLEEGFQVLSDKYPDTNANHLASLFRAKLKIEKTQTEESVADLTHYIESLPKSQRALGLYPRAIVYEDLSQWPQALEDYENILNSSEDIQMRKWALLGKARVLEQMNQSDQARAIYDQFLQDFASAPEASLARGLRARLGTE